MGGVLLRLSDVWPLRCAWAHVNLRNILPSTVPISRVVSIAVSQSDDQRTTAVGLNVTAGGACTQGEHQITH